MHALICKPLDFTRHLFLHIGPKIRKPQLDQYDHSISNREVRLRVGVQSVYASLPTENNEHKQMERFWIRNLNRSRNRRYEDFRKAGWYSSGCQCPSRWTCALFFGVATPSHEIIREIFSATIGGTSNCANRNAPRDLIQKGKFRGLYIWILAIH